MVPRINPSCAFGCVVSNKWHPFSYSREGRFYRHHFSYIWRRLHLTLFIIILHGLLLTYLQKRGGNNSFLPGQKIPEDKVCFLTSSKPQQYTQGQSAIIRGGNNTSVRREISRCYRIFLLLVLLVLRAAQPSPTPTP